jgi:serine/threonine protein kinase
VSDDPGPTRLGRYRMIRELGRGGMATVYSAVQEGPHGFENEVAIKLIHPHLLRDHPHVVRMVVDEARVASRIRHPNVVRISDLCEEPPDVLYVVMDYVDGVSMRQVLDTARAMRNQPPLAPVLEVLAAACDGLHAAHGATQHDGTPLNLVHRDVKPGNILVSSDGEVKVGDFGIAFFGDRLVESTAHGQMKGTPAYMSPEQVLGTPVDRRSDIFSMGLTLYTLTTAKLVFGGETPMRMAMKIAHESLEPHARELDEICFGLGDILRTACAKEPVARFPQAAAMGAKLREIRGTLRGKATIAEMVVASGWKPRTASERPADMVSIDARGGDEEKGTVVDVGPVGRDPAEGDPDPFLLDLLDDPVEITIGDEPATLETTTDSGLMGTTNRLGPDLAATTNEAPPDAELLPPDPYARPVLKGRAPRLEVTGSRPRVFSSAPPKPPPVSGPPPIPGPPPRPLRQAPPAPSPSPVAPRGPRRPPQVLERDYRGRVIRKKPVPEESLRVGMVEKLGVAAAFVMVLVTVVVIVGRGGSEPETIAGEPTAEVEVAPEPLAEPSPAVSDFTAVAEGAGAAIVLPPEPPQGEGTPEPNPTEVAPSAAPVTSAPSAVPPRVRETPTPALPPATGSGTLTVNSYPWAEVHLDGSRIGNTPVLERTLSAGDHIVRLVFTVAGADGSIPVAIEKQIQVDDGEHEKVVHRGR